MCEKEVDDSTLNRYVIIFFASHLLYAILSMNNFQINFFSNSTLFDSCSYNSNVCVLYKKNGIIMFVIEWDIQKKKKNRF